MRKRTEALRWLLPLAVGIAGAILAGAGPSERAEQLEEEVSSRVIRLHVQANSDSRKDQEQKLLVRDAVLEYLDPLLKEAQSRTVSSQIVQTHLEQVEETAETVLEEQGADNGVQAKLSEEWYPMRVYGAYTFPEGTYLSLQVVIGDGEGHNWWCVLYPGLCFTEAVRPVQGNQEEEDLKSLLPEDAYDFLLHPGRTKIRFLWF